jgi:hypothetical protein
MSDVSPVGTLRIVVGVVHNHNPDRLEQIRKTASVVANSFAVSGVQASVTEAHYAPALSGPQTISDVIALFTTDWVRAAFLGRVGRPKRIRRLLRRVVVALVIWAKRGQRDRELSVKRSISGKHLHLFETALNSDADFLMVLEDDAVLDERGAQDFGALIPSTVKHLGANKRWYLNLGGESGEQLIAPLVPFAESALPGFVRLIPAQVDTVCAFIVSRAAIEEIWRTVLFRPEIRASPPDHLMNYVMENQGIDCLHASPALFIHGSTSTLGSWH